MQNELPYGVINHVNSARKTDYLFRVSIKCLILADDGSVLVVKEGGRTWWDLPGGGMDHDENIKDAIARELYEEVCLKGDFSYRVIDVDEPKMLSSAAIWQLRLIFLVKPIEISFKQGQDCNEISFIDPATLENSDNPVEQRIYRYVQIALACAATK